MPRQGYLSSTTPTPCLSPSLSPRHVITQAQGSGSPRLRARPSIRLSESPALFVLAWQVRVNMKLVKYQTGFVLAFCPHSKQTQITCADEKVMFNVVVGEVESSNGDLVSFCLQNLACGSLELVLEGDETHTHRHTHRHTHCQGGNRFKSFLQTNLYGGLHRNGWFLSVPV